MGGHVRGVGGGGLCTSGWSCKGGGVACAQVGGHVRGGGGWPVHKW